MEDCTSLTTLITDLDRHNKQIDQFLGEGKYEEATDQIEKVDTIISNMKEFLRWRFLRVSRQFQIEDHLGLESLSRAYPNKWPVKVSRIGGRVAWVDGEWLECKNLENYSSPGWKTLLRNPNAVLSTDPDFIYPEEIWHSVDGAVYVKSSIIKSDETVESFFKVTPTAIREYELPLAIDSMGNLTVASYEPGVLQTVKRMMSSTATGQKFDTTGYEGGAFREIKIRKDARTVFTLDTKGSLDIWDCERQDFLEHVADKVQSFEILEKDYDSVAYLTKTGELLYYFPWAGAQEPQFPEKRIYEKITILPQGIPWDRHSLLGLRDGETVDVYNMNREMVSSFSLAKFVGKADIKTFDLTEGGKLVLGLSDGKIKVLEWDKMEE